MVAGRKRGVRRGEEEEEEGGRRERTREKGVCLSHTYDKSA